MPVRGPGGGTSFEGMSHEQMLAWLDRADAGQVQAAAGRLTAAAKAIREIAEELKVRPQWVAWKGEGANAFRTWSADLANSTLRLGDFSEDAAKWLTEASGAIAQAQASIPRETGGGARASNSSATATAPTPERAALAAREDRVREEAAAQMRKLTQTYAWSATQLNALERPKLPPPPDAIVPRGDERESRDLARPVSFGPRGQSSGGTAAARTSDALMPAPQAVPSAGHEHAAAPSSPAPVPPSAGHASPVTAPVTGTVIDSVAAPPEIPLPPTVATAPANGHDQAKGLLPSSPFVNLISPAEGKGPSTQASGRPGSGSPGPSRSTTGTTQARMPTTRPVTPGQTQLPGRALPTATGRATPTSRMPSSAGHGIVGGRPVTPPASRATGAIPRGTVVGSGAAPAHSSTAHLPGTSGTTNTGRGNGQPGPASGRRVPSSTNGIVGGRPIVSDDHERTSGQRSNSGVVRNGLSGSSPATTAPQGVGGSTVRGGEQRPVGPTQIGKRRGRTDGRGEDDASQPNSRRSVPPVVD
jgi:hypothetical protein